MKREAERRFSPGEVVAGRYRIHHLVGSGSMGEVYRADDTVLGKFVALKVPPASPTGDGAWRAGLRNEVRLAQQVSHPNVCRVFDLHLDGDPPRLAMEYIDGETLAEILGRRVGQLSSRQKLRIVQDLCCGLAAIHDQGVVHRDLKPSNVMIDGLGRTVITDFGLADRARAVTDPRSGTRVYMAPEQLAGRDVSERSDLYALGVLLFELFTGRHPLLRSPQEDLTRLPREELIERQTAGVVFPEESEDPLLTTLEGVIGRCLEIEPKARPASAREVADALPGEPLEIFRGSPAPVYRLLAAPGGGLRRASAWAGLAATGLGLGLLLTLSAHTRLGQTAARGEAPVVLETRGREILSRLGFAAPADVRRGFTYDPARLAEPAAEGRRDAVTFWVRQSPRRLPRRMAGRPFQQPDDPPLAVPGEVLIYLDLRGRLRRLVAVPPPVRPEIPSREPDWGPLLAAAGLDGEVLRRAVPRRVPPIFAEHRAAWTVSDSGPAQAPVRIEAAAAGLPVAFEILGTGPRAPGGESRGEDALRIGSRLGRGLAALWFGGVLFGALLLARRNLRLDTADRPAAFRLAVFVLAARTLSGFLSAHHLPAPSELNLALAIFARALLAAALVWLIYIALEPVVRRFSPERTASWVRLLYGRFHDPLVGRDLLVGGLFGLAALVWGELYTAVPGWLGWAVPRADASSPLVWLIGQKRLDLQLEALGGFRQALAMVCYAWVHAVLVVFFAVVGVVVLRLLLEALLRLSRGADAGSTPDPRWWWLSRAATFALFTLLTYPAAGPLGWDLLAAAVAAGLWLAALIRFGFLAAATATVFAWLLSCHPLTLDPTSWAAPGAAVPVVLTLAISLWGFRTSILPDASGDRSPVPAGLLDGLFGAGR